MGNPGFSYTSGSWAHPWHTQLSFLLWGRYPNPLELCPGRTLAHRTSWVSEIQLFTDLLMVSGMSQTALSIGCYSALQGNRIQAQSFLQSNPSGYSAGTCHILRAKDQNAVLDSSKGGLHLTRWRKISRSERGNVHPKKLTLKEEKAP